MSLRRLSVMLLVPALVLPGCHLLLEDVNQAASPDSIVVASFASPNIPLPNDIALQSVPTLTAPTAQAQRQLLQAFINSGGFPSDQEVSITIPFRTQVRNAATGAYTTGAPPTIDTASLTDENVFLANITGNARILKCTNVPPARPATTCWEPSATAGVLTLRKNAPDGSRRWAAGRYYVAVRGGEAGAKTTTGKLVTADAAIQLSLPNKPLTNPENQPVGGLPAALAQQIEGIRQALWFDVDWSSQGGLWLPTPHPGGTAALAAVTWPVGETASIATFTIAPSLPVVLVDSGSGVAPLPFDLLRDPNTGKVVNNPAFGAAAPGLATLDGFSTTAMILGQTSVPVDVSTVTGANVFVFRLSGGTATLVKELKRELGAAGAGDPTANPAAAGYVAQPTPINLSNAACKALNPAFAGFSGTACSPAIGLQPAASAPVPGVGTFTLPPLAEGSDHVVLVTKRVKDVLGRPLARSTVSKILLEITVPFWLPVPSATPGTSLLSGVPADTAHALANMKAEIDSAIAALPAGTVKADVSAAWTFRTQSVTGVSLSLAAAPYAIEAGAAAPIFRFVAAPTPVTAPAGIPTANVSFFTMPFNTVDAIDKATGALRPTLQADLANPAALITQLQALVAVPDPARVPACVGLPVPAGTKCAKLVVFGHGLDGSKETLFATASSLASQGFIAAAIDFPLHGGRNWCGANADCVVPGTGADGTCTPFPGGATQGDATPPGVCTAGSIPKPGGSRYFVSGNFFRIRDAFRQNLLDQSALVLAMNRPPTSPQIPAGQDPLSALLAPGVIVDPTAVYYQGISLGSIAGTQVVATNPRITRAALSVGGATFADIGTTSLAFQPRLAPFLGALLGVPNFSFAMVASTLPNGDPNPAFNPAVAAGFLQLVNVAKWVLDPGEPANYAPALRTSPLPNLLQGGLQGQKDVWGQISHNDNVVPNPTNNLLYGLIAGPTTTYSSSSATDGAVAHSILATSPVVQTDAATFLLDLTTPPAAVTLP